MDQQPEVDPTRPARAPEPRRGRMGVLLVFAGLALAAAVAYFVLRPSPAPDEPLPPWPAAMNEPHPPEDPDLTPEDIEAGKRLPPLGSSDPLVREWAQRMSSDPELGRWLESPDLLRRFTALVSAIREGNSPRALVPFLAPEGAFGVIEEEERLLIDPASYARYDRVARVLASLSPDETGAAFRALRPLLVAAWREIAPPGKTLHKGLDEAFRHLLAVPVLTGDVEVVPKGAVYAYADETLEGLTAAQKHLLRMGPENTARVQRTLKAIGAALGLPAAR
ncbi:MAG: DUF3014 domain-containing protein [Myxococcales bacterium]